MRAVLEFVDSVARTGPAAVTAVALALLLYAVYCTEWLRGPFHQQRVYKYFSSKHPRLHWPNQAFAQSGEFARVYQPLPFLDRLALGSVLTLSAPADPSQPRVTVPFDFAPAWPLSARAPTPGNDSDPQPPAPADANPAPPSLSLPARGRGRGVPRTVRVVSWNLEFAYCLSSIVDQLRQLDADVILLQEVDILDDRSSFSFNSFQLIADALGMNGVWAAHHRYSFAPNTEDRLTNPRVAEPHECTGRGAWGCAILSRFPLSHAEAIPFEDIVPGYGRSALTAVVHAPAPAGQFRVYSTHLEVVTGIEGRVTQFARIAKHHAAQPALPTIIAGDFNTLASGWLRFVPFYCTDKYRVASIGQSEPEWWQDNVFGAPGQLGFGFEDAFPVDAPTLDHWLVQPKLDWMLLRGITSVDRHIGDGKNRPSDHRYLLSDCLIGA